ncbi:MAG: glycoside hydrolase family 25 protein [Lachnospiraceae bacterium]|nr:glycoside hydrolase family 25 protein [Lachnospiraceae bacterium]
MSDKQQEDIIRERAAARKRAQRRGNIFIAFLVLLILTTGVLAFLLYRTAERERVAHGEAEAYKAALDESRADNEKMVVFEAGQQYSRDQLSVMLELASEEGADAREKELKDSMRLMIEDPNVNLTDAVRAFYDEYVVFQAAGSWHFTPIRDDIPHNNIDRSGIQVSENGTIRYMEGGSEVSVPCIDVSQFQGAIDWQQVADSGIEYAFIRCGFRGYGSGALVEDECFRQNMEGASAAGIKLGVYFFSQAVNEAEAIEEADMVAELIKPYKISLPVAIDVEPITTGQARADALNRDERTKCVKAFLERIKAWGYKPMIYGGLVTFFSMLDLDEVYQYPVWYAFYNDYIYYPYEVACWQYTKGNHIPGIATDVDLNIWFTKP